MAHTQPPPLQHHRTTNVERDWEYGQFMRLAPIPSNFLKRRAQKSALLPSSIIHRQGWLIPANHRKLPNPG